MRLNCTVSVLNVKKKILKIKQIFVLFWFDLERKFLSLIQKIDRQSTEKISAGYHFQILNRGK